MIALRSTRGIATTEAAQGDHGLRPQGDGRWIEIVFWTDNVDAAVEEIVSLHPTMGFNKPFVFWLEAGRAPLKVNYLVSPPYHVLAPES